jgi:FkbM family methyltransferase
MYYPTFIKNNFILTSSDHGPLIVNRNDFSIQGDAPVGIGHDILNYSQFGFKEIQMGIDLLAKSRKRNGEGVLALDCGANIGVLSIEWARFMQNWGSVLCFEPQEKIYYALCGNLILNNCMNTKALNVAVGAKTEIIKIPFLDHSKSANFGGFELKNKNHEDIGQEIDFEKNVVDIQQIRIDDLNLQRLDLLKIDVEGMEMEVLEGAKDTIKQYRPFLIVEIFKSDISKIKNFFELINYDIYYKEKEINIIACPSEIKLFENS